MKNINFNLTRQNCDKYNCIIAVTNNETLLIDTFPVKKETQTLRDLELLLDGEYILDHLIDKYSCNLPIKRGCYRGVIELRYFQCNHPMDPVEYETHFTLSKIFKY